MDESNVLPPEVKLFEYETCSDSKIAQALYKRHAALQSYLENQYLTLGFENELPCVRASCYVGLLPFSDESESHLLLIAPKGSREDFGCGLRRFLELLSLGETEAAPDEIPDGWQGKRASHQFLLFLAHHYAHLLRELCRRDFRSYYREEEHELRSHIRGRLDLASYGRRAVSGKSHLLPCRWDEFSIDNWDNRILWAAAQRLRLVANALDSEAAAWVWKPFQGLQSWFSDVADVTITPADFHKSRLGRTSRFYCRALSWARLLLQGSDVPSAGGRVPPLVFNANMAFQKFARVIVRSALPNGWSAPEQPSLQFRGGKDRIQPDLLVLGSREEHRAIGDAKYKLALQLSNSEPVEIADARESVHLRITSSDWYQLYVYMRMARTTRGFFVVPFWNKAGESICWIDQPSFAVPPWEGDVKVSVLCVNLLQPLKSVKDRAAEELRRWFSESKA